MSTLLILMSVFAAVFFWWSAARAAAERAEEVGRAACNAAGVQWLDQTVHADGIRLRRGYHGRLGLERSFRFEYSVDGNARSIGRLVLHGGELVSFSGPERATSVVTLH